MSTLFKLIGKDMDGKRQSETVEIADGATTFSTKSYSVFRMRRLTKKEEERWANND